jgi:hypothetical protein
MQKHLKQRMRWTTLLVLPMTLFLTACEPGSSDVVVQIVCPRINEYDVKTQDRALAEYNALPSGSALRLFIGDYKHLRDQVRVCRGEKTADAKPVSKPRVQVAGPPKITFKDRWHEGVKVVATAFR